MDKYILSNTQPIIPKIPVGIIGVGSYLPPRSLDNTSFTNLRMTVEEREFMEFKAGIRNRRWADGESHTLMAIKAAENALFHGGVDALDVDLVVVTHITRDLNQLTPPNSVTIQTAIGAKNATAINIDQGFTGWLYALLTGASYIASGFYKTVLVVSGESILSNTDSSIFKSMLMGDGAGAFILRETEPGYGLQAFHTMSWQYPEIAAEVKVSEHVASPFENEKSQKAYFTIAPDSFARDLPFVKETLPASVKKCLRVLDLTPKDIDKMIFAQKFKWLNEQWAANTGLNYSQVHDTLNDHACLETSSIPVITHDAINKNLIKKGDLVAFADLGSNWSVASAIFKWSID